jgi:hypothetical protein
MIRLLQYSIEGWPLTMRCDAWAMILSSINSKFSPYIRHYTVPISFVGMFVVRTKFLSDFLLR